ncbi:MAG TPA: hypothetical protein VJB57_02270 [Dehalococcoidia bacterium]|nr:hypothetical protein [Dehalococcoidia bacterium]
MANPTRTAFLADMAKRFGAIRKLDQTQSLFEVGDGMCRVYIRFSKLHSRSRAFFGLRKEDLRQLEGHRSFVCFLWDAQAEPLLVPFAEFEEVFAESTPASDGQYKVQVFPRDDATILYIARAGRYNVEGYFGWIQLEEALRGYEPRPSLSHPQVQTLLGAIGAAKQYSIWVPLKDRLSLDWRITPRYDLAGDLPPGFETVRPILQEIDVIWIKRGSAELAAVYEVEHSTLYTPAY